MKTATAKELKQKTAAILDEVRRGRKVTITYRGKSVAILTPVVKAQREGLTPIGFGMWQGRKELRSVEKWLKDLRKPRYPR